MLISSDPLTKGHHRQIWYLGWSISKNLLWNHLPNETKLCRKHLLKVIYKDCSCRPNPLTDMVAIGNSCFWLLDFWKSSPLKPLGQMNQFGRKHLWKVLYKDCWFLSRLDKKHGRHEQFLFLIGWNLKTLLIWMNCYFVVMMYGRSCTTFPYFMRIILIRLL